MALPAAWVCSACPVLLALGLGVAALLALGGGAGAARLRWGQEPWFRYRPYRHARR